MAPLKKWLLMGITLAVALPAAGSGPRGEKWVATWACATQLTEPANLPPSPGFKDCTLRQFVRVSLGGRTLRVLFSNEFGDGPLTVLGATVAPAAGGSAVQPGGEKFLSFGGRPSVVIPAGAPMLSDPLDFKLKDLDRVALTLRLKGAPRDVTSHPGSRTTSYILPGDGLSSADFNGAVPVDHWYFLGGIEVRAPRSSYALAALGDSITDGRGTTTNQDQRWTDYLARRLEAQRPKRRMAVLNLGIGGNRLLQDGLGPNALARLDRDVLARPGIQWLIVLEGVNDLGTAPKERKEGKPAAAAQDLIDAYGQIIERAHARGLRVFGATLTPFGGSFYSTPREEADRQAVNRWIRTSGAFDGVVDFDAALRDPAHPDRLSSLFDSGDHLHPNPAGYQAMAAAVDWKLFTQASRR